MEKLVIYTDGASRGNPGQAAIAFIICGGGKILERHAETIGKATNNEAEYMAIIRALEKAASMGAETIGLFSDSEVVIRQLRGEYKIKEQRLKALFTKARGIEKGLKKIVYNNLRRSDKMISLADSMVNEALDNANR